MAEITTLESFEAWLEGKDKETCIVLASRIAQRVLPSTVKLVHDDLNRLSQTLILPLLRASALPWFAGTFPNHGAEVINAAIVAADAVYVIIASYDDAYDDVFDDAYAVAYAVAAAAGAAYNASYAYALAAAGADVNVVWRDIYNDIVILESGVSPQDLMRLKLWQNETPLEINENWSMLKTDLLSLNDNWQVWTNWYEDRLVGGSNPNGRPVIEELELKRVLIADEDWKKGPSHVNAMIAALEEEYRPPVPSLVP